MTGAPADGPILDPFAGPGGWSEALRLYWPDLHAHEIGVEYDRWACATRAAAGHRTVRADVARFPLEPIAERYPDGIRGVIASPPCQTFSAAGGGAGRKCLAEVADLIADLAAGRSTIAHHTRRIARTLRADLLDRTSVTRVEASAAAWAAARGAALSAQPMRYVVALNPTWVVMEQVPAVLPLWQVYEHHLRRLGFSTWSGILNAANYGVPQTRRRAILCASRVRHVGRPNPTHEEHPDGMFALAPWVSMAAALDWPEEWATGHATMRGEGMAERHGDRPVRPASAPSEVITGKARCWTIETNQRPGLAAGNPDYATRDGDEPAPTVVPRADAWKVRTNQRPDRASHDYQERSIDCPAPTMTRWGSVWTFRNGAQAHATERTADEPAPTILGSADNGDSKFHAPEAEPARLTIGDALVLQSFRRDYPVVGTRTAAFLQVGNAIPVLLARAALGEAVGPDT